MSSAGPNLLAVGPWSAEAVTAEWSEMAYQPSPEMTSRADVELQALRDRGSPSHDGLSARLVDYRADDHGLHLVLQPARWALRLLDGPEHSTISSLCVVRAADGRWLAGLRAGWLANWAGRWALGAGGAVDVGENPVDTLARELEEEWGVTAESVSIEALVRAPSGMALLVGMAHLAEGVDRQIEMDPEHDEYAWWPANPADWPKQADDPLRAMAAMLDRDRR